MNKKPLLDWLDTRIRDQVYWLRENARALAAGAGVSPEWQRGFNEGRESAYKAVWEQVTGLQCPYRPEKEA